MPDHAAPPIAVGTHGFQSRLDSLLHGVELVVAGDDFDERVAVRVGFEDDEMPQEIEKPPFLESAANLHLQFERGSRGFLFAFDCSPWLEPFPVGR